MTDASHITQLGGVQQEIQDLKSVFESSINQVKVSIYGKFSKINLQSGVLLAHQLVNQFYYSFCNAFPLTSTQNPIVVYFIICLFVIIKSNSKILIALLDFFHDTSVNCELINCSQHSFYCSKLPFIPDFVNQCVFTHIRCKSIPLILCTRYLSKLLFGSHFHHLDLQFLLIRLSFLSATTPVSCYCQRLSF